MSILSINEREKVICSWNFSLKDLTVRKPNFY